MDKKNVLTPKTIQPFMENVLTPKTIQPFMGIGRVKAYELFNSKGFPSFRIGKKLYVSRSRLEQWMLEQEEKKDAN